MIDNKPALYESLADTGVGLIINLPITWLSIYIGIVFEMSVGEFTLFQTVVFTIVSLIRKYVIRNHFSKIENNLK